MLGSQAISLASPTFVIMRTEHEPRDARVKIRIVDMSDTPYV